MVGSTVRWHRSEVLKADRSQVLGISIGNSPTLIEEIEEALPDTYPESDRPIIVGTDVTAILVGNPQDVQIEPDQEINASTGSDIGLLWSWDVRPLRPNDSLRLTAKLSIEVPGTEHTLTRDVPLTIEVQRTLSSTASQVFDNWGTLAAVTTSSFLGVLWLWRRRQGKPIAQALEPRTKKKMKK